MKRRLNILCIIVVLVLGYSVLETGYYFIVGVKAGVEAGTENAVSAENRKELINMKYISLLPEHLSGLGDNGLFQFDDGQRRYEVRDYGAGGLFFTEFASHGYMYMGHRPFCPFGDFHQ